MELVSRWVLRLAVYWHSGVFAGALQPAVQVKTVDGRSDECYDAYGGNYNKPGIKGVFAVGLHSRKYFVL